MKTFMPSQFQHQLSMIGDFLIESRLLPGVLTSDSYRHFLENVLVPELDVVPSHISATTARAFLNENSPKSASEEEFNNHISLGRLDDRT